jgi:hypothetical protein
MMILIDIYFLLLTIYCLDEIWSNPSLSEAAIDSLLLMLVP